MPGSASIGFCAIGRGMPQCNSHSTAPNTRPMNWRFRSGHASGCLRGRRSARPSGEHPMQRSNSLRLAASQPANSGSCRRPGKSCAIAEPARRPVPAAEPWDRPARGRQNRPNCQRRIAGQRASSRSARSLGRFGQATRQPDRVAVSSAKREAIANTAASELWQRVHRRGRLKTSVTLPTRATHPAGGSPWPAATLCVAAALAALATNTPKRRGCASAACQRPGRARTQRVGRRPAGGNRLT